MKTQNQLIYLDQNKKIEVWMKREDLIHPFISGNKYRKLKYNLEDAQNRSFKRLLTFGGAYSNHIAAVAYAGKLYNFETIGIIRGEELEREIDNNPTLNFARENGMKFKFISRSDYQNKENQNFIDELFIEYENPYIIPEGGTNNLAIKGCEEILDNEDDQFNYIACAVGTGGTISGIINSSKVHQKILGFPALKGDFLKDAIRIFAQNNNWELITDYHFGGYGKVSEELIIFMNNISKQNHFLLDPVYTAKLTFGVMDLLNKNYFPEGSKILLVHTGGIQGIEGMNKILEKKNLLKINTHV